MKKYLVFALLQLILNNAQAQEESLLDLYPKYLGFGLVEKIYDSRIENINGNEDKILIFDSDKFKLYKDSIANPKAIKRISIRFSKGMDLQQVFNDLKYFPNLFYLKFENLRLFGEPTQLEFPQDLSGIEGVGFINFYGNFKWNYDLIFKQLQQFKKLKYLALTNFGEDDELSENIGLLSNLEGLALSGRYGAGLPESVKELKKLKSLVFSADLFPDLKAQLLKFKEIAQLKEFYFNSFELSEKDYDLFKEFGSIERLELHNVKVVNLDKFLNELSVKQRLYNLEIFGSKTSVFQNGIAQFENLRHLRLERLGDNIEIPAEIYQLRNLEYLKISDNATYKKIDPAIQNLKKLKKLTIFFSELNEIPEEISQLTELEELNLRHNKLESLPDGIVNLTSLQKITIDGNRIRILPKDWGKLINLKELDLKGNILVELPNSFSDLQNLEKLFLDENDLKLLPENFGNLRALEELGLSKNLLKKLPESFGNLSSLRTVRLDNNNLTNLPENIGKITSLENIYLNNHRNNQIGQYDAASRGILKDSSRVRRKSNSIRKLPLSFSEFKNIQTILLAGNPIDSPALFQILQNLKSKKYHLNIENCNIKYLPSDGWSTILLKSLNLSNNRINKLPPNIVESPYLESLNLNNNPIEEFSRNFNNKEQLIIAFNEAGFIQKNEIPKNTKIAQAYLNLGNDKKDPLKKLDFYEKAFEIDSLFTDSQIRNDDYADALLKAGDYKKAIKYYSRAIEKDTARGPYILNFIVPNFQNRAKAHLLQGDTLAAINGLVYVSGRFSSGNWGEAALLAKKIGKDSLASQYFKKGKKFYEKQINRNEKDENIDFGYQLSLLELYIIEEDFKKATDYYKVLIEEDISEKGKRILLEYFGIVLDILKDGKYQAQLTSFKEKIFTDNFKINSWSFELFKNCLKQSTIESSKKEQIYSLTFILENKK